MTLYDDILKLLNHRMIANIDTLGPLYLCGIGAHIFNLMNKEKGILVEGGLVADARVHVIMVTIPGFGKSFILRHLLDKEHGICAKTKIKPKWLASMTTASFVGSIKSDKEGNKVVNQGICDVYKSNIVGIHEFAGITKSMSLSYNVELHDALLSALDDGQIRKDVAAGNLEYITKLTLFTAVQPARYELSSGLGRRLCFLVYIPTYTDIELFRQMRRKARGVKDDGDLLFSIRTKIDRKFEEVKKIEKVEFDNELYDWMNKYNIIPYEEIMYERIAIGYTVMNTDDLGGVLRVKMDQRLRSIMMRQREDRKAIKSGIELEQVWRFIKNEKTVEREKLKEFLFEFSLDRMEIERRLKALINLGWIRESGKDYLIVRKEES